MIQKKKSTLYLIFFVSILLVQPTGLAFIQTEQTSSDLLHTRIINQGYTLLEHTRSIKLLEYFFEQHPQISFASTIHNSMTIKFVDNTYRVLFDLPLVYPSTRKRSPNHLTQTIQTTMNQSNKTAMILNPSEYLYGNRHCTSIIHSLNAAGYTTTYLADDHVTLSVIKQKLTTDIVYLNTHAGYWDIDNDQIPDAVVIATGEHWTQDTPTQYSFEYNNHMIIKGMVGTDSFIAFTPALIEYYYDADDCSGALIYMATCHAAFDDSMAQAFLSAGAATYMGWTKGTISWTNSYTSQRVFSLLNRGYSVHQICRCIRFGGVLNFFLFSRLTYYGDGSYKISSYQPAFD